MGQNEEYLNVIKYLKKGIGLEPNSVKPKNEDREKEECGAIDWPTVQAAKKDDSGSFKGKSPASRT